MYLAKNSPFQLPLQLDHMTQFWPRDTEAEHSWRFLWRSEVLGGTEETWWLPMEH